MTRARTILYVEDNEANRMIVRDLLKRTKYALIEARDGEAGVAAALEQRPDLILMDIQLPKLSGLDAIRRIRADSAMVATPIVAIMSAEKNCDGTQCVVGSPETLTVSASFSLPAPSLSKEALLSRIAK